MPCLEQLVSEISEHCTAEQKQHVISTPFLAEQCVPKPNAVREGEFLSQQERDPAEGIELGVDLQAFFSGPRVGSISH